MPTLRFIVKKGIEIPRFKEMIIPMKGGVVTILGPEVEGDVAVTAIEAFHVENDADVQLDVMFSAGDPDVDPSPKVVKSLKRALLGLMIEFIDVGISKSVWVLPMRGTSYAFSSFDKPYSPLAD